MLKGCQVVEDGAPIELIKWLGNGEAVKEPLESYEVKQSTYIGNGEKFGPQIDTGLVFGTVLIRTKK